MVLCQLALSNIGHFYSFPVLVQAPKLLDLDLMNGVATEEGDSELLLKVDLQHFGEVRNYFVCKT